MDGASAEVPRVRRTCPLPNYVLPNGEGTGYGLFALDDPEPAVLPGHLPTSAMALTRGIAWVTLWDDMLEGGSQAAAALRSGAARAAARSATS